MSRRNTSNTQEEEVAVSDDTSTEETTADAETPTEGGEESKAKQKRDPLPEGYVTPVGLTNALNERAGVKSGEQGAIRPQMIYGYKKNNNANFREAVGLVTHSDGREILVLAQGLAWWDEKEQRKSARAEKASA